jgi:hypothetical protein
MKTKDEFIKEFKLKKQQDEQARLARLRGQKSPNQVRLFEKMGMRLRVSNPADSSSLRKAIKSPVMQIGVLNIISL